jgi:hypothetical protein
MVWLDWESEVISTGKNGCSKAHFLLLFENITDCKVAKAR